MAMNVRRIDCSELPDLLRLYGFLHPEDPRMDSGASEVKSVWTRILGDQNQRYFVAEDQGRIVATCCLTLVPNLTRGLRPYGPVENVVTDPGYRRRGFATQVLRHTLSEAWRAGCYKVMLLTGSKKEETWLFYENAGFRRGMKTGFIAYPPSQASWTFG